MEYVRKTPRSCKVEPASACDPREQTYLTLLYEKKYFFISKPKGWAFTTSL